MDDWYEDGRPHVPNGRPAASGPSGTIHLSFRSGSRGSGASASAAFDYVSRSGQFEERELDEALHVESDHMPAWAVDALEEYWDAADLFERANGRLYVSADFALPRGLELADQIALARAFAHELTDAERLPYTLAIHAGRDASGAEHNPHAHILISERKNDGIVRDRTQWFGRANSADPARGGAPKTRSLHGEPWMERARSRWAALTNEMLASRGRPERVDHRSYARQGIEREPGRHFGPAAAHLLEKGRPHERVMQSADVDDRHVQLDGIDSTIAALERERASLLESEARERGSQSGGSTGSRSAERTEDQSDDWMPGR
jgi:hypothetical protein